MKPTLTKYLSRGWGQLRTISDDPKKTARGFALGVFIGMTPFVGFQVMIAIFLATMLKWNRLAAGLGVFNTNILTGPFLFGISYLVGAWALQLDSEFDVRLLWQLTEWSTLLSSGKHILYALLLGGLMIGLPLSIVVYYLSYFTIVNLGRKDSS